MLKQKKNRNRKSENLFLKSRDDDQILSVLF